jgi:hypothetical protein
MGRVAEYVLFLRQGPGPFDENVPPPALPFDNSVIHPGLIS